METAAPWIDPLLRALVRACHPGGGRIGCGAMTLSLNTRRLLEHVEGYLLLGMKAEAAEALGAIADAERDASPVLHLRSALHVERAEWAAAADLLKTLCEREPGRAEHWIQQAYATRRHLGIEVARVILLRGLELHPREATIHFNLACYEAQIGRLIEARAYLATACLLDKDFTAMAKADPDLAPLW
ncbi:MAG: hypothetical protein H7067_06570 [Burkholderiales bacterium]|nr:hypothetical protein [Opitutaceae bacterium]